MCAFYYKETKASNIFFPGTEVICAMYITLSYSFSSWLSEQTFFKLLGCFYFGTESVYRVSQEFLKTRGPLVFIGRYPKPAGNTHQFHRHAKDG